MSYTVDSQLNK